MFLITFVSLMIAVIGLYAQVLGLQTARLHNSEIGFMQTMLRWHSAATSAVIKNPPTNMPCQMSWAAIASPPLCTTTGLVTANMPTGSTYNASSFSFMTQVFQNATGPIYTITYVDPSQIDAYKNLLLPNATVNTTHPINYTFSDLGQQFAKAAPTYIQYGSVNPVGTLTIMSTGSSAASITLTYTVPATINAGSFAVISAAQ